MEELLSLQWKNHSATFLKVLVGIRKNQTYSDVTLACSGKFYGAHKMVLTACSDYFKEIFEHTDCKRPVIVLNGINYTDLENLLDYMYIGDVTVKQCDVDSLIKASECLQIKGLAIVDDESPERSKTSSENITSLNVKNKRKAKDYSNSSEAKHFKTETKLNSSNESLQTINKTEEFLYEVEPVFIKEEISESTEPVHDIKYDTLEHKPTDDELKSDNFLSTPSCSQPQEINFDTQSLDVTLVEQAESYEWSDGNTSMIYSSLEEQSNEVTNEVRKKHGKVFRKGEFKCPYCDRGFDYNCWLQRHIRIHTGETPFSCDDCSYKTGRKGNLKLHIMEMHKREKPFSCKLCPYKTSRNYSLMVHVKCNHKKKFIPT